jgi:hypothetical protein
MTTDTMVPIACALSAADFGTRAMRLRHLASAALKSYVVEGSGARLTYEINALPEVERMVQDERRCCGFLKFDISHVSDGIEVKVSAPPEAADDLRLLLSHLIPTPIQPSGELAQD